MSQVGFELLGFFTTLSQFSTLVISFVVAVMLGKAARNFILLSSPSVLGFWAAIAVFCGELASILLPGLHGEPGTPQYAVWYVAARVLYSFGLVLIAVSVFRAIRYSFKQPDSA